MFEPLDKTAIPTGYLRDYAVEDEDFDLFDGQSELTEHNLVTLGRYANLLSTICSASVLDNEMEARLTSKIREIEDLQDNGTLRISCMLFSYASIKENALKDGIILYKDGQVYNTRRGESPYEISQAFAGCCLDATVERAEVQLLLPKNLCFSNCNVLGFSIDYGRGYQDLSLDTPLPIHLRRGENDIKLKVISDEGVFTTHFSLFVISKKAEEALRGAVPCYVPSPDMHIAVTGGDYRGIRTTADVYIKYATPSFTAKMSFGQFSGVLVT